MVKKTSDEARKGLFDSLAGKAKEVAGALTGKDELAEEGQLQQATARARREANTQQAVADAQAKRAADELREEKQRADKQRAAADAAAHDKQRAAQQQAADERDRVEAAARRQEQADKAKASAVAEEQVHDAHRDAHRVHTEAQALEDRARQDHDNDLAAAAAAERRAAKLRADARSEGTN